jgi:hypothetical protein
LSLKIKWHKNSDNQSEAATCPPYPTKYSLFASRNRKCALSACDVHAPDISKCNAAACLPLQHSTVLNMVSNSLSSNSVSTPSLHLFAVLNSNSTPFQQPHCTWSEVKMFDNYCRYKMISSTSSTKLFFKKYQPREFLCIEFLRCLIILIDIKWYKVHNYFYNNIKSFRLM